MAQTTKECTLMTTTAELERQRDERLSMFQARYDQILEPLKRSAAPPPQGISVNEYRRRSLGFIQRFLPPDSKWRNVSLDGCKSDALSAIEPQILNEARLAATNPRMLAHTPAARPDNLDPNLKSVTINGVTTYHGEHSFVKSMSRPGRLVTSFTTDTGRWNARTGAWF
jgi:hypothetical protein